MDDEAWEIVLVSAPDMPAAVRALREWKQQEDERHRSPSPPVLTPHPAQEDSPCPTV